MNPYLIFLLGLAVQISGLQYIEKEIGKIYFYQEKSVINYDLSLNRFYTNARQIEDAISKLDEMCIDLKNDTRCLEFIDSNREELKIIKNNVNVVRNAANRVKKRSFWLGLGKIATGGLKLGGKGIIFSAGAYSVDSLSKLFRNGNEAVRDMVENQKMVVQRNDDLYYNQIMASERLQKYNDLIKEIMERKSKHYDYKIIILKILTHEIVDDIFDIVDFANFTEKIDKINAELAPKFTLPQVNINDLIELSRVITYGNKTNVRISIEIPIIDMNEPKFLKEFIPVPFLKDDSTNIFDISSELYFMDENNNAKIMPKYVFDSCKHIENIILCNSVETMNLESPNECIFSLTRGITPNCTHKIINTKNYWMKTSKYSIFCYIIDPVKVKITCDDSSKIYNLNKNQGLDIEEDCDVVRMMSNMNLNSKSITTEDIIMPFLNINLTTYDPINKNWTFNMSYIDKDDTTSLKIKRNLDEMDNKTKTGPTKRILGIIAFPFKYLVETITGNFFEAGLVYLLPALCIYILFFKCLCRRIEQSE